MSFGGHVMDAINRMRYNESLKKAKRERIQRVKKALSKGLKPHESAGEEKHFSKEEIAQAKAQIAASMKKEKIRNTILSWLVVILVIGGLVFLIIHLKLI